MSKAFASSSAISDFIGKNNEVISSLETFINNVSNVTNDLTYEVEKRINEISTQQDRLQRILNKCEYKLSRAESALSAASSQNASTPSTISETSYDSNGNKVTTTKPNPAKAAAQQNVAAASSNVSNIRNMISQIRNFQSNIQNVLSSLYSMKSGLDSISFSGISNCQNIKRSAENASSQASKAERAVSDYGYLNI